MGPVYSAEDFKREALPALREAGEKGLTLLETRKAMFTGEGWTPRETRKQLERLTETGLIRHDETQIGRRYYVI